MKIAGCFLLVLLSRQAICGIIRNPPAFAKPVYSDSYLPAAMQVIFHAVEQLKALQAEEAVQTSTLAFIAQVVQTTSNATTTAVTLNGTGTNEEESETATPANETDDKVEQPKVEEIEEDSKESTEANDKMESVEPSEIELVHQETPEVNEETPETNYATPETNYETPENVHAVQETNQEFLEENHEGNSTEMMSTTVAIDVMEKKKEPTIDSVVHDVYQIVKPTVSKSADEEKSVGDFVEKMESVEEEEDENRFTRLGEKVPQVPRPSLSSYLRRAKVPMSATLLQLANLYDSLSKDARKQGFGKYTGYSDEVLNALQTSAEGGLGPQMKMILGKVLERNELTRDDAKQRTNQTVRDLDNTSSNLSKELRLLLPLRYTP